MRFIDTNRESINYDDDVIEVYIDGENLSDKVSGLRILTVAGRETLSYELETEDNIPGRDGSILLSKHLPARELEVTYQLTADSDKELQEEFRNLTAILYGKEDREFVFGDDPDYYYLGQLSKMAQINPSSNQVVSSFTIYCQDPFIYSNHLTSIRNASQAVDNTIPTVPELIIINLISSVNQIKVLNRSTGRKILIKDSFAPGNSARIDIRNNKITLDGRNITKSLDYVESDWHQFILNYNNRITVEPDSDWALIYRTKFI